VHKNGRTTSRNMYCTAPIKCCTLALKCMLACYLGMRALALQMLPPFSSSTSSILALSKCFNNPRMGAPSYPSRPHEGSTHFAETVYHNEQVVMASMSHRKTPTKSMEMLSQGLLGTGNGMYKPSFSCLAC
jgi:hypothetical protein